MEFWRLVKNFLKGENKGGSKKAHGGGMKKCKKQLREKRTHLERCARSYQRE